MSYLYNYWGTEPIILFFSFLSTIGQTFVYEGQLSFGGQNCISLINIYSLIFIWQKKKKKTPWPTIMAIAPSMNVAKPKESFIFKNNALSSCINGWFNHDFN